jgi:hypothetical protein
VKAVEGNALSWPGWKRPTWAEPVECTYRTQQIEWVRTATLFRLVAGKHWSKCSAPEGVKPADYDRLSLTELADLINLHGKKTGPSAAFPAPA